MRTGDVHAVCMRRVRVHATCMPRACHVQVIAICSISYIMVTRGYPTGVLFLDTST